MDLFIPFKKCLQFLLILIVFSFTNFTTTTALEVNIKRIAKIISPTNDFSKPESFERRPAGAATVFKLINQNSFSHSSANMSFERELDFKVGNGFFRRVWVSSPASTKSADGLGPIFNARSCQGCHLKDGRGHTPSGNWPEDNTVSMFLRLSIPPQNEEQRSLIANHIVKVIPSPKYGIQLQDIAIQGHNEEGKMHIEYEEMPMYFTDGKVVNLRKPTYKIIDWKYGAPNTELLTSPRVAPPMIGLGMLEAISDEDILANSDPNDDNKDGISGKPNLVWDIQKQDVAIGSFGCKAGEPNLRQQASAAFNIDLGISGPLAKSHWGDCTTFQRKCRNAPNGNTPEQNNLEISLKSMDKLVFYSQNLAVPARRNLGNKQVLAGKKLFYETGCISCHRPKFVTKNLPNQPEQSFQLIWPYTDLLLHNMGEGLADNRPEGEANGFEWRTAPLWGIGLTKTVNGHTEFLHDGRARNLLEAILWHGGEAENSKKKVLTFDKEERQALLSFLNSL